MLSKEHFLRQWAAAIDDPLLSVSLAAAQLTHFVERDACLQVHWQSPWPFSAMQWQQWQARLATSLPAYELNMTHEQRIKARQILPTQQAIPGVKNVMAVASGKGGVGKSTVAVGLARSLAKMGAAVALMDADVYGPSVLSLLGLDGCTVPARDQRFQPLVSVEGVRVNSMAGLVGEHDPLIWRGPMASKAVEQLAYQTDWGDLDYLIIDMPPGTGDIALTCAKKLPLTAAILVTTPHHLALMDAQRACEMFKKMHCPLLGVVSNMAYFTCTYCDEAHQLFAGPVDEFIRNNELNTLSTFPLAQDSAQLLWSTLAARSAAGLCCLQERRGVRMPPVVAETV